MTSKETKKKATRYSKTQKNLRKPLYLGFIGGKILAKFILRKLKIELQVHVTFVKPPLKFFNIRITKKLKNFMSKFPKIEILPILSSLIFPRHCFLYPLSKRNGKVESTGETSKEDSWLL